MNARVKKNRSSTKLDMDDEVWLFFYQCVLQSEKNSHSLCNRVAVFYFSSKNGTSEFVKVFNIGIGGVEG